jgi:type IV pilus assembly protein PilA
MKTSRADFSAQQGFTLVELLVVILVVGILTAISLPSLLNQTAKARQAEAKQKVSTILKIQKVWYIEHESFTNNIDDLALGSLSGQSDSPAFNYAIVDVGDRSTSTGATAKSNDIAVKSYSGRIDIANAAGTNNVERKVWNSIVCESNIPGTNLMNPPAGVTAADCAAISAKVAP